MAVMSSYDWGKRYGTSNWYAGGPGHPTDRSFTSGDRSAYAAYTEEYNRQELQAKTDQITADFKAQQDKANAANEKRYQEGIGIYDQMISDYQSGSPYSPTYQASLDKLNENISEYQQGGTYGEGAMAMYDVGARNSRASAYQSLVSSGMSNITSSFDRKAALDRGLYGKQVEDERTRFLSGARSAYADSLNTYDQNRILALERSRVGKTGFIERREDIAPDPNLLATLITQASSAYAPGSAYTGISYGGGGGGGGSGGGSAYSSTNTPFRVQTSEERQARINAYNYGRVAGDQPNQKF